MKITFQAELQPSHPYDLPQGTMVYDGYTPQGLGVHVVEEHMASPEIWNNASVVCKSMLED